MMIEVNAVPWVLVALLVVLRERVCGRDHSLNFFDGEEMFEPPDRAKAAGKCQHEHPDADGHDE